MAQQPASKQKRKIRFIRPPPFPAPTKIRVVVAGQEASIFPAMRREDLIKLWDENTADEFVIRDAEATLATMTDDAYVNHIPVMTGGNGRAALLRFYSTHFIPVMPPDTTLTPVSRTVGEDQLVD